MADVWEGRASLIAIESADDEQKNTRSPYEMMKNERIFPGMDQHCTIWDFWMDSSVFPPPPPLCVCVSWISYFLSVGVGLFLFFLFFSFRCDIMLRVSVKDDLDDVATDWIRYESS